MHEPAHDTIRFSHASARGRWSVTVDLHEATIEWRDGRATTSPEETARLRALAEAVGPEHAALQPTDLTYAQDERLEIVLHGALTVIDASSGEIAYGPPAALVDAMQAVVRAHRPASR